ncbi:MAG: hypothetical protein WBD27_09060 [Pyrinomonadaceae bacterium]
MNQDDKLYIKLRDWIRLLSNHVIELHGQRQVFERVQAIIQDNPLILDNVFLGYVVLWYTNSMSIAIRRLRDAKPDSISFMRILQKIKANPKAISRTRTLNGYERHEWPNEMFDSFAGTGNEYLDQSIVDADIRDLISKTKILSDYADRIVAHNDSRPLPVLPTFNDLSETIVYVGELHNRYLYLLTGVGTDLVPSITYDWEDLFRIPWIPQRVQ